MRFLGKNQDNNKGLVVVVNNNDNETTAADKSKRKFSLFGSKKKQQHPVDQPSPSQDRDDASKMVFQHKVVTVDGDDIPDANNVTVDSVESILVVPSEDALGDEMKNHEPTKVMEIRRSDGSTNESLEVSVIGRMEEQQQGVEEQEQDVHQWVYDEKKEETEPEQTTANISNQSMPNSFVEEDDDDDDGITEKPPPLTTLQTGSRTDEARKRVEQAAGAFVQALTCTAQDVRNCATLPASLGGLALPSTTSKPIINEEAAGHGKAGQTTSLEEFFHPQETRKFLNNLLNVGFTLVYHTSLDDEDDWIGRTVNLNFRPGICSARTVVGPAIEWKTMGGGKAREMERQSIGLLEIDTVMVSNIRNELDPASNQQYEDELDCFFSITSQWGEVFLFEALSAEESHRIVTGIKSIAFCLSSHIIAGDSKAVADYFDNSNEPTDIQLRTNAAMMKISHAFLDDVL
ncbi:hypothetical protein IV203_016033 [Nitzschia inconspicua]|uniref:Uncharacterized protein n=1 Tax=Nitzschia inconspicua TaxID=303405 RepID=A0A9K3KQM2_9STRA|nr:hypothetical protein IV203_016033 [Nitzschia inconspicua]